MLQMHQVCRVCGDPSAAFYCGAHVCEACKKFFIRSWKQSNENNYVCLQDNKCLITKETRKHCASCRYDRCLQLEMYLPGGPSLLQEISRIPCRVCCAPSSGFHFGTLICEGCKGFFRRCYQDKKFDRFKCNENNTCHIIAGSRSFCKACRLNKCLSVGMQAEKCRIGRQPNIIKHVTKLELQKIINSPENHYNEAVTVNDNKKHSFQEDSSSQSYKKSAFNPKHVRRSRSKNKLPDDESEFIIAESLSSTCSTEVSIKQPSSPHFSDAKSYEGNRGVSNFANKDGRATVGEIESDEDEQVIISSEGLKCGEPVSSSVSAECDENQLSKCDIIESNDFNLARMHNFLDGTYFGMPPIKHSFETVKDFPGNKLVLVSNSAVEKFTSPGNFEAKLSSFDLQGNPVPKKLYNNAAVFTSLLQSKICENKSGPRVRLNTKHEVYYESKEDEEMRALNLKYLSPSILEEPNYVEMIRIIEHSFTFLSPILSRTNAPILTEDTTIETMWKVQMQQFERCAHATLAFARRVPGFRKLPMAAQIELIQKSLYPVVICVLSSLYDPQTGWFSYFGFSPSEMKVILTAFPLFRPLIKTFVGLGKIIKGINMDSVEIAFLCAVFLLDTGDKYEHKELLIDSLECYVKGRYGADTQRHHHILMILRTMSDINQIHKQTVVDLLRDPKYSSLPIPQLYEETFFDDSVLNMV